MKPVRPGDQPLPVPNNGPHMHDLVCADLEDRYVSPWTSGVRADLQERKRLGTERYGTPLQAFNNRDALRDLYEELLDAAAYAKQAEEERKFKMAAVPWENGDEYRAVALGGPPPVYEGILNALILVKRSLDERDAAQARERFIRVCKPALDRLAEDD